MRRHTQILVIGGGPAGATTAALLARAGLQVTVAERDVFPRYHIGESIIPSCVAVLRLSGALEKVDAYGLTDKRGGVFRWASDEWTVDWGRIVHPDARSWQVDRDAFDLLLLDNAAEQGAEVHQNVAVKRLVFDGDRPVAADLEHRGDGTTSRIGFDFLVDASGRAGLMSRRYLKNRRPHEIFQNIAVWGYWNGGRLLPGGPEGAINVVSAPNGWYWNIPLPGDRLSIGYVTHKQVYADQRPSAESLEAYYLERIAESESMRWITEPATFQPGVQAEQDFSYVADRFAGPGYIVVGDAACFLDPLLATGVHLATYSSLVGSAAVASALHGELPEDQALDFFEYAYRRAYCRLLALVSRLYQRYDGKDSFFWQAQRLTHEKEWHDEAQQSFMDITAGLTDLREAADADVRVVTQDLLTEAQRAQDQAEGHRRYGFPALDMGPMWDTWHHAEGPESAVEGLYVTTEPRLGLRRTEPAKRPA